MQNGVPVLHSVPSLPTPADTARRAPAIGDHVPYITDAPIAGENIADPPVEEIDSEEEEAPFIAEERVRDATSTYRPRREGPAMYASRRDYIIYHMQRRDAFNRHHALLSYGKLTQKYIIHQAWLVFFNEEDHQRRVQNAPEFRRTLRNEFISYHQRRLQQRNENDPNVEHQKIGRIYQMPTTSRQAPKNIHVNITRAMAIRKAVDPKCGFFITFTFNCGCPEICTLIGNTANPADYPDLCCRLSTLKFRQLLKLCSGPNGLFGPVKGWLWSLEYQKRGNKHWHLVLMLDPAMKVDTSTPEFVDQYISAKVPAEPVIGEPDYESKKYYYDLVTSLYIHDCEDNPQAACRVVRPNGDCRFGLPVARHSERTVLHQTTQAGVTYARPSENQGGNAFFKRCSGGRMKLIDSRYVVPHNRVLTMLMGCHICVEFITQYSIWFYLFKYSYKADSKVQAALYVQDRDDPTTFHADEFNVRRELAFYGPFEACDILRSKPWAGR
jgi:hypothetical protein